MVKGLLNKVATTLATGVSLSVAFAIDVPKTMAASLAQQDLFFGRNIPGGGEVSEEQFQTFVDSVITPRFPAGLTVFNANGQFRNSAGTIIDEKSKVVTLFLEDTLESKSAVNEIVAAYLPKYNQESVLQVFNKDHLKVGFGAGENLIDNDPVPEFIRADLFFGRNIPDGGEVSEEQFQAFVDSVITPRFPAGLTAFNAEGQFRDSTGTIINEKSKVITLLFEDIQENEDAINEIISSYIQQFNQESVLAVVDEDIHVAFTTEAVPEPSSVLGLLTFGTMIVGFALKKKRAIRS